MERSHITVDTFPTYYTTGVPSAEMKSSVGTWNISIPVHDPVLALRFISMLGTPVSQDMGNVLTGDDSAREPCTLHSSLKFRRTFITSMLIKICLDAVKDELCLLPKLLALLFLIRWYLKTWSSWIDNTARYWSGLFDVVRTKPGPKDGRSVLAKVR